MNITLQQLRIFLSVVEHKSLTKAAEALHLTQPGVSIQLKNLQDQFSAPVFEIIRKKIYLTEFGHEIVKSSRRIFEEMDRIQQKNMEIKGLLGGKIRISSVSTGKYIIPYIMSDFMNQHPQIEIRLEVSNRGQVIRELLDNSLDLALVSILPENISIEKFSLVKNSWVMACAPKKKALYQDEINKGNWENIPFILRENGSGTRTMMENYFSEHRIPIKRKMEFSTNEGAKHAVMAGLGVSVLSVFSMPKELEDNLIETLPAPGFPLEAEWNLIWLKSKKLSPASAAFLQWLKENHQSIVEEHFAWADRV